MNITKYKIEIDDLPEEIQEAILGHEFVSDTEFDPCQPKFESLNVSEIEGVIFKITGRGYKNKSDPLNGYDSIHFVEQKYRKQILQEWQKIIFGNTIRPEQIAVNPPEKRYVFKNVSKAQWEGNTVSITTNNTPSIGEV